MPIVIFLGISSVGAVFMVLFFAALCSDQGQGSSEALATPSRWLTRRRAVRPPSVVKIGGPNLPRPHTSSAVIVLTPRIRQSSSRSFGQAPRVASRASMNISVEN